MRQRFPSSSSRLSSTFPNGNPALLSRGGDAVVLPRAFRVNLASLPWRPWCCCYRSIRPPSSCLVPFQGILTPPLVSQGGRSGAKYRKCCVSPSSPPPTPTPQCQPPFRLPPESPNYTCTSSRSDPSLPPQHHI